MSVCGSLVSCEVAPRLRFEDLVLWLASGLTVIGSAVVPRVEYLPPRPRAPPRAMFPGEGLDLGGIVGH